MLKKLALDLPGFANIKNNPVEKAFPADKDLTLAKVINEFAVVAIYIGAFLMFFWAIWGVFDYLRAEGNKEALAKARKKIIWAISGFIILLVAFFVSDTLQTILFRDEAGNTFNLLNQKVQSVTPP